MSVDGYRPNVGIVLCGPQTKVLLARRSHSNNWQLPQGGIQAGETPEQAMYRELHEEIGLGCDDVEVIGRTRDWLYYDIPKPYRREGEIVFSGQKQLWFLLKLRAEESRIRLDVSTPQEFDHWRWADYWEPPEQVIDFKKDVYRRALQELSAFLSMPG